MSALVPAPRPHSRELMRRDLIDAERGWRKELRDVIARLPDPREYAYRLPADVAEALLCARQSRSIMYLPPEIAPHLRPYGLCDYPTNALTAFGYAVWRELREMDA